MTAFWWSMLGLAVFVIAGSVIIVLVARRQDPPLDEQGREELPEPWVMPDEINEEDS